MDTPPFVELGLPQPLLEAVAELGYERPSPIQALTIPAALEGRDLVGLSQTGSGKTAAFALPTLARLDLQQRGTQALVLCPTRELALQVCEDVYHLGHKLKDFRVVPVYGGAPIDRQARALERGAQVVVGTPGRLLDHLRRRTFDPRGIRTVVLDEADRMLDMGFREEMEELLGQLPPEHQTLFFSATMAPGVKALIERFGRQPQTIRVETQTKTVDTIAQEVYEVRQRSKVEVLCRLLDLEAPRLTITFANTKRVVDEVCEELLARGYAADRLHGDCTQAMRERTLRRFREREVEILVATDVAARGLDVEEIDLVVNLELPQDPEDYVHRIGRTGRAGRSGKAVTFVFGRDTWRLQSIERAIGQKLRRQRVPSQEQVEGRRVDQLFEQLKDKLEEGGLEHFEEKLDRLLEQGHTPTDIANAAITLLRGSQTRIGEEIPEDRQGAGRDRREPSEGDRRAPRESFDADRPAPRGPREPRDSAEPAAGPRSRPTPADFDRSRRDDAERGPRRDFPDRGERRERPERRFDERGGFEREDRREPRRLEVQPVQPGMARLFLTVGKEDRVKAGDLVGMFYNEGQLPGGTLGAITLFPRHSIVDVPEVDAEAMIERLARATIRGRRFRIDFDRRA